MRRTDLDSLRILICFSVIFAHALLIFAFEPRYSVKSVEPSLVASVIFEFIRSTAMALFFVIAGYSAVVSLRGRTVGQFVKERVLRLLIPLLAGVATFGSVIKYIELSQGRDFGFHGFREAEPLQEMLGKDSVVTFFDFFPLNLTNLNQLTWSHLWFLDYLFLLSILLLPLLLRLAKSKTRIDVPSSIVVYLPALLLAAILVPFKGYWPYLPNLLTDWQNFAYFGLCILIGAGMAVWPGFETRLRTEAPRLLMLTLVAFSGLVFFDESAVGRLCVAFTAWSAAGAALGYAARFRPAASPTFNYLSEATLPIYIIHHAPLLLIGLAILPLPIPDWIKMIIIWLSATAVSFIMYHFLVKPWWPVRWLFGMNPAIARSVQLPSKRTIEALNNSSFGI